MPYAKEPVEALVIPPRRLRDLLVAEAELGERIMRALILRRVGLLESGAGGPVIVGRADNGDVLRLRGLSRAATAIRTSGSIPTPIRARKALIERFHVDAATICRSCCAPTASCCAIPSENELARCIGLVRADRPGPAL